MNYLLERKLKFVSAIIFVFVFSSCGTTLAPSYDQAIVDGMVSSNQKLMELFASTSSGTDLNDFDERAGAYNSIIGNIEALAIQAKSRPMPKNKVIDKINEHLRSSDLETLADGNAPSATALEKISETITTMRDRDKSHGLSANQVNTFKSQTVIYLNQAMTYESFLKR